MIRRIACEVGARRARRVPRRRAAAGLQLLVREPPRDCAGCGSKSTGSKRCAAACASVPTARRKAPPDSWTSSVLEQVKVERQLSWHTWLLGVFDDMHLVWPALGATAAVVVCLLASAGVMQATNEQRPDSLAGIIGYLASPGSNVNPARIDGFTARAAPLRVGPLAAGQRGRRAHAVGGGHARGPHPAGRDARRRTGAGPQGEARSRAGDARCRVARPVRAGAGRRRANRGEHDVAAGPHHRGGPRSRCRSADAPAAAAVPRRGTWAPTVRAASAS